MNLQKKILFSRLFLNGARGHKVCIFFCTSDLTRVQKRINHICPLLQSVFRGIKLSEEWWVLLLSNLGVKPTWLLRETGNSALEAEPRIPPNQKNIFPLAIFKEKKCEKFYLIFFSFSFVSRTWNILNRTFFTFFSVKNEPLPSRCPGNGWPCFHRRRSGPWWSPAHRYLLGNHSVMSLSNA